jgi:DNA-binding NarL/FixJ family response regulator
MTELGRIRVVAAERSPLIQAGIRYFLQPFPDLHLVGAASSVCELSELCERLCPDVLLIDIDLSAGDVFAALKQIKARRPGLCVVVLTSLVDRRLVRQAMAMGVSGYLLKDVSAFDLAQALRSAVVGRLVLAQEATEALVGSVGHDEDESNSLSRREQEVLQLVAQGQSNNAIAEQLCISRSTVKYHVSRIFEKLGVSNRAQAIALAHQMQLTQGLPSATDQASWAFSRITRLASSPRVSG